MKEGAISYVRVSSKNQDLDRQINELNEYAKSKTLRLIKCFKDTSSASKSFINEREKASII